MTKKELKTASLAELIVDTAKTEASLMTAYNQGKGCARLEIHMQALCCEMMSRGIISENEAKELMFK